jgi:hypothetical protein
MSYLLNDALIWQQQLKNQGITLTLNSNGYINVKSEKLGKEIRNLYHRDEIKAAVERLLEEEKIVPVTDAFKTAHQQLFDDQL